MQRDAVTVAGACDAQGDHHAPYLAVLGVLSTDATASVMLRDQIRRTWWHDAREPSGIVRRFVMRGVGATQRTAQEHRAFGDIIRVAGNASLGRRAGPLLSLLLWYRCATTAWPQAALIGKADEDAWVDVGSVEAHLRLSLSFLERRLVPSRHLYWGVMETFHWNSAANLPSKPFGTGFGFRAKPLPCRRRWQPHGAHALLDGPFHFARGALFFLSAELCSQLATSALVATHASQVVRAAPFCSSKADEQRCRLLGNSSTEALPWEDVFVGWALATVAWPPVPPVLPRATTFSRTATAPLVAIDVGRSRYQEGTSGLLLNAAAPSAPAHAAGTPPSTGTPMMIVHAPWSFKRAPDAMMRVHNASRRARSCASVPPSSSRGSTTGTGADGGGALPPTVTLQPRCEKGGFLSCSQAQWLRCRTGHWAARDLDAHARPTCSLLTG